MDNNSKSKNDPFLTALEELHKGGIVPSKFFQILKQFYQCYNDAVKNEKVTTPLFTTFISLIKENFQNPYSFEPFHKKIRSPFDYYQFGLDFLKPLLDKNASKIQGLENVAEMVESLKKGENVILLANHQSEIDPQAISALLEDSYPQFGEDMIFVAGERVVTDPLAIPFSMGRNLLCIYSKKYIDHPPELKREKQLHNKRTMQLMRELLSEGGKVIYVAPSGGRDRRNAEGIIEVAPFDPQSIEMFYLMAKKAKSPTHFHPLALTSYEILPPPDIVQKELGEVRSAKKVPIHIAFGKKIDMESFPGSDVKDKVDKRKNRARFIWDLVHRDYQSLIQS